MPGTPSDKKAPEAAKKPRLWVEWVKSLLIAVFIALLIRWPLIEPFKIPSGSMEPTFYDGDRIFVNKYVYGVRYPFNGFRIPFTRKTIWYADGRLLPGKDPERWDIVVFKSAENGVEKDTLVKRIVGLPGERILVHNGKIHINGKPVEPKEGMPGVHYTRPYSSNGFGLIDDDAHSLVPEGHYFLMGDNSEYSRDGRWFGWVPNHNLLGRVSSIWWPVKRWHDFTGFSHSWWWNGGLAALGLWTFTRMFVGRSWRCAEDLAGGKLRRGNRVFVRYSLGIPVPFTHFRIGSGRTLRRGDLVLHRLPEKDGLDPVYRIALVAGLPGERVLLKAGILSVDDAPPDDFPGGLTFDGGKGKYAASKSREFSLVPDGHWFLLSDATENARDSRTLGWIAKGEIVGHVSRVWWPLPRGKSVAT